MREFSGRSQIRLQEVHEDLRKVMREACVTWSGVGKFEIAEARRTVERQKELFAKGKTKTMNSRHLHGFAVDIAYFYDIDKDGDDDYCTVAEEYIPLAKHILHIAKQHGVILRWGGDWDMDGIPVNKDPDESFFDACHFELHKKYYPDPVA